jgi:hypothetical protein
VECRSAKDVDALASAVGVRNIASMPLIRIVKPMSAPPSPLPQLATRSDYSGDVPTVVVVDSGIEPIPGLESWVVGRESAVAPRYRNTDHGTFVAGLICWGGTLNPGLAGIDQNPCAVFDLQVIPNDDPEEGDVTALYEQEFLASLEDALRRYANQYRVWNLSLGTDVLCSLDEFSALAEELDNLQEKYRVSFVISAGNYTVPPLLTYPRTGSQKEEGRITVPADSVLSITVGSISHASFSCASPALHCPSSFSRHGSGPNYVIKPDVVHYGGAASVDGSQVAGVKSVCPEGASTDGVGTSYSTPLVSRILAQIYHQVTPTPSPVLARALLTHHARDPRSGMRVPDGEEDFFGFGLPSPVPYCLECTPYCSTMVFEDVLRPGYFLEWDDFPYPPSLTSGGRYFGEITMTVAFEPTRGARWGSEYCETHVEAHFGVWRERISRKTGEITTRFTGLVPPEHRNPGLLYESYQVEKLRKWAPVRTYRGDLGEKGERGIKWRLKVQLTSRHAGGNQETLKSQPFSLIVTIADPRNKALVYDEMARILKARFQFENLAVRAATRVRGIA